MVTVGFLPSATGEGRRPGSLQKCDSTRPTLSEFLLVAHVLSVVLFFLYFPSFSCWSHCIPL